MRLTKTLGMAGALLLAALVGGTLIGSTLAADEETDAGVSGYCETFRDSLAAELGVTTDALTAAGKAAADATIDAALAAGDIDEDRAAILRERVAAYDGEGCGFGRGFALGLGHGWAGGFERGMARGFAGAGVLESAADALGMDVTDLRAALGEAASLEAIATEQGMAYDDVEATVLADVEARLDDAVANGLDQARADAMLEHVSSWLDQGGQLDELGGLRGGPGMGRGDWQGRGHGPGGRWGNGDVEESGT